MKLTIETVILGTATVFTVMPLMVLFGAFPGVTDGPCSGWHGCEGVFDDPSGCVTLWEVVDFECEYHPTTSAKPLSFSAYEEASIY